MTTRSDAPIEWLPAELIDQIIGCLLRPSAFGSVAALARCSRRLHHRLLPLLYDHVSRVQVPAGQNALVWAAEHDEIWTLKTLLDCGVDPNARFWSAMSDSVRHDVLVAQDRVRCPSPVVDGHLISSLLREEMVWNQGCTAPEQLPGRKPGELFTRTCT